MPTVSQTPSPNITAWPHWCSGVWKEANPCNHVPILSGKFSQKSASCYNKKMANTLLMHVVLKSTLEITLYCTFGTFLYRWISFCINGQLRSQLGETFVTDKIMSSSMTLLTSHFPSSISNWSFYSQRETAKISNMCLKFIVFFCFLFQNEVHQKSPRGSVGGRG